MQLEGVDTEQAVSGYSLGWGWLAGGVRISLGYRFLGELILIF